MSGSLSFCGSFMIPVTTLSIVMFAERQAQILPAKPNLLNENILEILTRHLAINTEFLLSFYKSNLQMRVFWSNCRALLGRVVYLKF
jgi:septum formation topological specificity factor MinE